MAGASLAVLTKRYVACKIRSSSISRYWLLRFCRDWLGYESRDRPTESTANGWRMTGHPEVGRRPASVECQLPVLPTLLANRDARTEVRSFQIYSFKVRAQIGTSNVEKVQQRACQPEEPRNCRIILGR